MGYSVRHRGRQTVAPQAFRRLDRQVKRTHSLRYRVRRIVMGELVRMPRKAVTLRKAVDAFISQPDLG